VIIAGLLEKGWEVWQVEGHRGRLRDLCSAVRVEGPLQCSSG
jgi:hypothetical protein